MRAFSKVLLLSSLLGGCTLIGYDELAIDSGPDSRQDAARVGDASNKQDATRVSDASNKRDAAPIDGSQKDAAKTGPTTDSGRPDASMDASGPRDSGRDSGERDSARPADGAMPRDGAISDGSQRDANHEDSGL